MTLNRDVALNILPAAFVDEAEQLARFTREAHTLPSLNHTNITHPRGRGIRWVRGRRHPRATEQLIREARKEFVADCNEVRRHAALATSAPARGCDCPSECESPSRNRGMVRLVGVGHDWSVLEHSLCSRIEEP